MAGHPWKGPRRWGEAGHRAGTDLLESDDLAKEFEVLRSRGVKFEESEPTPYPFGVRLTALDPDGNRPALRQRSGGSDSW